MNVRLTLEDAGVRSTDPLATQPVQSNLTCINRTGNSLTDNPDLVCGFYAAF